MAQMNEVAARIIEHLCAHDAHGYTQGSRWGNGKQESIKVDGRTYWFAGGDRDCSSAVISAYQAAGLQVGATYTGNMRELFLATGLFEWKPMSFVAQRGDIYLNEANHTAMCTSANPDLLGEFCIAETGGVYGREGDQTGREAYVHGYYDYPWDGILHFKGGAASGGNGPLPVTAAPRTAFRVKTSNGWLKAGKTGDGTPIVGVAIDFGGHGWYQVCTQRHGWLERVRGYDLKDAEDGYAGYQDSPVVAVRAYYETPEPGKTGYFEAKYRAADYSGKGWWPWQYDDDTWNGQDGYAGDMRPIDRFQIELAA